MKWLFQLPALSFGSSLLVCHVNCIWALSIVRPFLVLRKICLSCLLPGGGNCSYVGRCVFVVVFGV